jgi:predicted FMN-binding regulatory protein PaiB
MYAPEYITEEDIERLVALIREYPFAMPITVHEELPANAPFELGVVGITARLNPANVKIT